MAAASGCRSGAVRFVRALAGAPPLDLTGYLRESGRELGEVYTEHFGWRAFERAAGRPGDDDRDEHSRRLGRLVHADDPAYLATMAQPGASAGAGDELGRRRLLMLEAQVQARGVLRAAEATATWLRAQPDVGGELATLATVLGASATTRHPAYPEPDWPLALHRRYQRRELVAAVGERRAGDKISVPQGGILKLDDSRRELLFVTLDKSGGDFSATTRYRDYAISRELFHWETQGVASVDNAAGRRYLGSPGNGWRFFLFVRLDKSEAYTFLGPVTYRSHTGDRPIAITWQLTHALPADLLAHFQVLAPG